MPKKIVLITLLTIFFLFDDLLFYLLIINVYDLHIRPAVFALASLIVVAMNYGLAILVFRIMKKKPTTGAPGMIGKVGVVMKTDGSELWLKIQGEIWRGEGETPLRRGDEVVVTGIHGLTLRLKKRY